jgi:hypothetical protein
MNRRKSMAAGDPQNKKHCAVWLKTLFSEVGEGWTNSPHLAKSRRDWAKVGSEPNWCESCFNNKLDRCACENYFF